MKKLFLLLTVLTFIPTVYATDQEAAFINKMVEKHHFKAEDVKNILSQAKMRQDIIDKISKPAEHTLNWGQYRKIFLTPKRIQGGVKFWKDNAAALEKMRKTYGVPPQIVIAIIGVETFYGRITGKDKVLDALYTLAFHYPKRSKFFTSELENYLLLTRQEKLDPGKPKGSYAGAMGLGQFMPSSYMSYAVDFDADGKRDIWHTPADAIGSVANYFRRHGWKPGLPVAAQVSGYTSAHEPFIKAGKKPRFTVAQLRQAKLKIPENIKNDLKTALIELKTQNGSEYWAALHNFYVITRYNHSKLYAMAVFQLSESIKQTYTR